MKVPTRGSAIEDAETQQFIARCRERITAWNCQAGTVPELQPEVTKFKYSYHLRFALPPSTSSGRPAAVRVKVQALPTTPSLEAALLECHQHRSKAAAEYESLELLWQLFGNGDPDHSALRPIEKIEPWGAILMEELPSEPLRRRLEARPRGRANALDKRAFLRAGTWLGKFHQAGPQERQPLPIGLLTAQLEELDRQVDGGRFEIALSEVALLLRSLDGRVASVARVHGDYHPENVLVTPDGRIAAIDLWPGPDTFAYRDLATLLTYTPLIKRHQITRGFLVSSSQHAQLVDKAVAGYAPDDEFDRAALAFFCALRILEKWRDNKINQRKSGARGWADDLLMMVKESQFQRLIQYWLNYSAPR